MRPSEITRLLRCIYQAECDICRARTLDYVLKSINEPDFTSQSDLVCFFAEILYNIEANEELSLVVEKAVEKWLGISTSDPTSFSNSLHDTIKASKMLEELSVFGRLRALMEIYLSSRMKALLVDRITAYENQFLRSGPLPRDIDFNVSNIVKDIELLRENAKGSNVGKFTGEIYTSFVKKYLEYEALFFEQSICSSLKSAKIVNGVIKSTMEDIVFLVEHVLIRCEVVIQSLECLEASSFVKNIFKQIDIKLMQHIVSDIQDVPISQPQKLQVRVF